MREWTQDELADMVGADRTKIHRIETGKTALKVGFLEELASEGVFNVPKEALLIVNPEDPKGARTAELLTLWGQLDEVRQDILLQQMRGMHAGMSA